MSTSTVACALAFTSSDGTREMRPDVLISITVCGAILREEHHIIARCRVKPGEHDAAVHRGDGWVWPMNGDGAARRVA